MYVQLISAIVFAYLLGSVSTAVLVCKIFNKPDPRTAGSKNPGATNVLRLAGKPYAVMVLIGDVLKGIVPVYLAQQLQLSPESCSLIALFAVLGHMFPIFLRFNGGKGVATAIGAMLTLSPLIACVCLLTFIVTVASTRMVSLGSILGALTTPIATYLLTKRIDAALICLSVLIICKHHTNIRRILEGQESRLGKS